MLSYKHILIENYRMSIVHSKYRIYIIHDLKFKNEMPTEAVYIGCLKSRSTVYQYNPLSFFDGTW